MKKTSRQINLFDISKIENKSSRSDKIRTTDINILLNRVRITKKNEFKRKITYLSLTFLVVGLVGLFSLI
tara:strand:+ start:2659 stop:2868 length:210 start_codon:yes stop_codon:yes gene_type:complete